MNAKLKKIIPTTLIVLLALPLVVAGLAKLAGTPELHQSFEMMGMPTWFGYFIGLCELVGGIGLLISRFSALAALALIPIMLGATYFHLAYEVPSALPAIVFTLLAATVVYLKRQEAIWFPGN